MAFGLHCTNCGKYETEHLLPNTGACDDYESPSPDTEAELKTKNGGNDWPDIDLGGSVFDDA